MFEILENDRLMRTSERTEYCAGSPVGSVPAGAAEGRRDALFGRGTAGNEQQTSLVGVILLVLMGMLGITIVQIDEGC